MSFSSLATRSLSVAAMGLLIGACSSASPGGGPSGSGGSSSSGGNSGSGGRPSGSGGSTASGGSTGSGGSTSGSGGSTSGSGGSSTGTGGTVAGTGGSGAGGSAQGGSSGDASATDLKPGDTATGDVPAGPGWAGFPGVEDFSTVKKTDGCGMDPGQALGSWVKFNITVTPKPVKGMGMRSYFVKLPANYDRAKAYHVVVNVPGCGGTGDKMFDFTDAAGAEGVIQFGLNADPMAFSYAGCFDDFATASVEPQYIDAVLEATGKKLCFDKHRVFFTGHSSGSFVSNMMGCMWGGTKVRAIAPSSGGLADNEPGKPNQAPPCVEQPTAGIWSHNEDDGVAGSGNLKLWTEKALTRALRVNKCMGTLATSPRIPFPGNPNCEKFSSCPPEFPIVYCHPKVGGHEGNKDIQPARSWAFWKSLP